MTIINGSQHHSLFIREIQTKNTKKYGYIVTRITTINHVWKYQVCGIGEATEFSYMAGMGVKL